MAVDNIFAESESGRGGEWITRLRPGTQDTLLPTGFMESGASPTVNGTVMEPISQLGGDLEGNRQWLIGKGITPAQDQFGNWTIPQDALKKVAAERNAGWENIFTDAPLILGSLAMGGLALPGAATGAGTGLMESLGSTYGFSNPFSGMSNFFSSGSSPNVASGAANTMSNSFFGDIAQGFSDSDLSSLNEMWGTNGGTSSGWSTNPSLGDLGGGGGGAPGTYEFPDGTTGGNVGGFQYPAAPGSTGGLSSILQQLGGSAGSSPLGMVGQLLSSLAGFKNSGDLKSLAAQAAMMSDPFGPQRPQYQQMLAALMRDPSSITTRPGYNAGLQAVERRGAAQGWNGSGNMMAALANYGGQFYNDEVSRLMTLAGANIAPGNAGSLSLQGNIAAQQTQDNALARLGLMLPRGV